MSKNKIFKDSDITKVGDGFSIAASTDPLERDHALSMFNELITPEFLEHLNQVFIHRDRQSNTWQSFAGLTMRLEDPDAGEEHSKTWSSMMLSAVRLNNPTLVKLCASELHTPESAIDHPLMKKGVETILRKGRKAQIRLVGDRAP